MAVRGQRQQARDETGEIVDPPGFEERAVTAIVKNDKYPHHQRAGEHCERDREPPRNGRGVIHQRPAQRVGRERVDNLPSGAPSGRFLVLRHDGFPFGDARLRESWVGIGNSRHRKIFSGSLLRSGDVIQSIPWQAKHTAARGAGRKPPPKDALAGSIRRLQPPGKTGRCWQRLLARRKTADSKVQTDSLFRSVGK